MKHEELSIEDLMGPLNEVETKNAPKTVFIAGDTSLIQKYQRVAIVGSRKASDEGIRRASVLARKLVERKVVVVSGLADGIDTAAHTAGIVSDGKTIAVLGTALNEYFPKANHALQDKIGSEHLLISQFPEGYPSKRENFPLRNRTMALISDAAVIVEASNGSGSLHLGWEALRLGRPLFILESILSTSGLTWPEELMQYGAKILSRDNIECLFEALPENSRLKPVEFSS